MPTYSYLCTECAHEFEIHQSFSDDSLTVCPVCQGVLRKVFSPVGVSFSGPGFYRTDSREQPSDKLPARPGGSDKAGSSQTAGGSETATGTEKSGDAKKSGGKHAPASTPGSQSGSSGSGGSGSSGSGSGASSGRSSGAPAPAAKKQD